MDNQEIWSDVKGYEGLYQVSNWGRVKSLVDNHGKFREKILSPRNNGHGYLLVCLYKGGKQKTSTIHRLVLSTFSPVENMENLEVNHLDENKENNNLSNLEWCDRRYNLTYNDRHKKVAEKNSIPIVQLNIEGKYIRSWKSSRDVEREVGFDHRSIINCCKNKFNREGNNIYKGFRWMYLSEYMDKHNGLLID